MKEISTKELIDSSLNDDIREDITEFEVDIAEFDESIAYLESIEDLTEKTITYIEREVRNSFEYRSYITYLKEELDLTRCSLLPGIDIKNTKVSLEFHHYPFNLYEISEIVATEIISKLDDGEKVSCFDISEKIVEEHYKNHIGLVPLTETLHKMAHNRAIIIPTKKVTGNYNKFIIDYNKSIPEDLIDRIREAEINSNDDDAKLFNQGKLSKNISHYDITYYRDEDEDNEKNGGTEGC